MDFSIKSADSKNSLATIKTDCILVGVYEDKKLTSEAAELDNQRYPINQFRQSVFSIQICSIISQILCHH